MMGFFGKSDYEYPQIMDDFPLGHEFDCMGVRLKVVSRHINNRVLLDGIECLYANANGELKTISFCIRELQALTSEGKGKGNV